ncbi:MAG: glycogen/starch/alpha-glucan phosphorylase [Acidobacteria bacterium]|jgi:starch phosphorylase|nr:glycogen/starch/alpha-glucan phosphorylase [Acidobacteriota bacterium]
MPKPRRTRDRAASRGPRHDVRTALDPDALAEAILDHVEFTQGRPPRIATPHDWYMAAAFAVRDRLLQRWIATIDTLRRREVKVVSYLSAEFLMGPHLGNNLVNLGALERARTAVERLGIGLTLDELMALEEEPGLGNGGLGRLAACFLESLSTLEIPAIGYGIRYEFGIFDQEIRDGRQVEITDKWLRYGNPWEIGRPELARYVGFGGRTEWSNDRGGRLRARWVPERMVKGVPYDTPVVGYRVNTANLLRLWRAEACESFDFDAFNQGDYLGAVDEKLVSENITKVLYPNDEPAQGKELRLQQQFFFVSCSLQNMLQLVAQSGEPVERFADAFAVQLNDTHPSIAVAELMRLLVDEHGLDWEPAWEITRKSVAYTNHTLLPEALERWPLPLFRRVLPRHLEIIFEINRRFLDEVRARFPGDEARAARLSLIDEAGDKAVRMAHLAAAGSHAVNGVAAMHTGLLKTTVMHDFHELAPERFFNVTNGVTPRRWVALANPALAALITERIGGDWLHDAEHELKRLEPAADDAAFRERWRAVKRDNKRALARLLAERAGVEVDPDALFDVQVKRIHEYKRQHLNLLHVVTLYQRILADPRAAVVPRVVIFGGKAAPGYFMAKLIIRLINAVGAVVNADPVVAGRLRVAYFPDFNVKNAQRIYPAADLSEQISTAGKEASGTGNMKFAFNGALTIGTLDGANVEIREAVGPENFFLFGLTASEVSERKASGYDPRAVVASDPELRAAIDGIASGRFSGGDAELFRPFVDSLLGRDEYLVLADYRSYVDAQARVSAAYLDPDAWTRMSILNTARVGSFSSDRSIREYAEMIWKVRPVPVEWVGDRAP